MFAVAVMTLLIVTTNLCDIWPRTCSICLVAIPPYFLCHALSHFWTLRLPQVKQASLTFLEQLTSVCRYFVWITCLIHVICIYLRILMTNTISTYRWCCYCLTVTRQVPLALQEIVTLLWHTRVYSLILLWVRVAKYLVFCLVFCQPLFSFFSSSFGHYIVCFSLITASDFSFSINKLF